MQQRAAQILLLSALAVPAACRAASVMEDIRTGQKPPPPPPPLADAAAAGGGSSPGAVAVIAGALRIIVSPSGVVSSLGPANVPNFSFTTAEFGDVTLRTRTAATTAGQGGGGNHKKTEPQWVETFVKIADASALPKLPAGELAAASMLIPSEAAAAGLTLEQHWAVATDSAGGLLMWFTLQNNGTTDVEVGGFAVAMPSNEKTGGNLEDLAQTASFADPHIGGGHGYLTMTRLTGRDGVLMIVGENGTSMEAFSDQWSPLGRSSNAWSVHSKAFFDKEWSNADGSWINATGVTIPAGGSLTRDFRIALATDVQHKQSALEALGRPVLSAVPGYVVATDMTAAKLFVKPPQHTKLIAAAVVNDAKSADPKPCMSVGPIGTGNTNGWIGLPLTPLIPYCRCRVELRYSDGSYQVASYFVLPALNKHVATFGKFQATTAFYDDGSDPFGRSPSVMPWNRAGKAHVLHDPRNFIVGLSDEGGAGANVGFAIKQYAAPVQEEVSQLDRYINSTLYGVHCPAAPKEFQTDCSLQDHKTHGIKASLFWTNASGSWDHMSGMPGYHYQPQDFTGWKWDRPRAYSLFRAYNYPHQSVVYHSMYRLARDHPTTQTSKPAVWYLKQCANTIRGAWSRLGGLWYMQQGLMAGSVWLDVLRDLELEAEVNASMFAADAEYVQQVMANRTLKGRGVGGPGSEYFSSEVCPKSDNSPFQTCSCSNCTDTPLNPCKDGKTTNGTTLTTGVRLMCKSWADNTLPYGSEFSWDSTGQEEAYVWGRHFNQSVLADTVLAAILAYDPSVPNWAYHGAALSYGDVGNNGYDPWNQTTHKTHYPLGSGSERISGHYRSGERSERHPRAS
jgi:hypothetical protein